MTSVAEDSASSRAPRSQYSHGRGHACHGGLSCHDCSHVARMVSRPAARRRCRRSRFRSSPARAAQPSGPLITLLTPLRIYDSRTDTVLLGGAKLAAGNAITVAVSVPDETRLLMAAFLNVTITETEGAGFLRVSGTDSSGERPVPVTSNINWSQAGQTLANLVLTIGRFGIRCRHLRRRWRAYACRRRRAGLRAVRLTVAVRSWRRSLTVVVAVAVLVSPALRDHDSFPLSTYPVYASARFARGDVRHGARSAQRTAPRAGSRSR